MPARLGSLGSAASLLPLSAPLENARMMPNAGRIVSLLLLCAAAALIVARDLREGEDRRGPRRARQRGRQGCSDCGR
jgi:hypothetical protein